MDSMILLVAMIAVFYFLIIRPENKRKKQAEQMRSSLKKGDRVTVHVSETYSYDIVIRDVQKGSDDESLPISSY